MGLRTAALGGACVNEDAARANYQVFERQSISPNGPESETGYFVRRQTPLMGGQPQVGEVS